MAGAPAPEPSLLPPRHLRRELEWKSGGQDLNQALCCGTRVSQLHLPHGWSFLAPEQFLWACRCSLTGDPHGRAGAWLQPWQLRADRRPQVTVRQPLVSVTWLVAAKCPRRGATGSRPDLRLRVCTHRFMRLASSLADLGTRWEGGSQAGPSVPVHSGGLRMCALCFSAQDRSPPQQPWPPLLLPPGQDALSQALWTSPRGNRGAIARPASGPGTWASPGRVIKRHLTLPPGPGGVFRGVEMAINTA